MKDYTYLTTTGEAEARMVQELLKSQGIPSRLHASSLADVLSGQAVHGNLPYEIRVPKESLGLAKDLIGIKEPIAAPDIKLGYPKWVKVVGRITFAMMYIIPFLIAFGVYLYFKHR